MSSESGDIESIVSGIRRGDQSAVEVLESHLQRADASNGEINAFVTRTIVASATPEERTIASSAVPTMQRIGYAVGAATTGIIANAAGFSEGLNATTAASVAAWLFLAFVPLALLGCVAAVRISGAASGLQPETA